MAEQAPWLKDPEVKEPWAKDPIAGSETVAPEEMARIEKVSDLAAKAKQTGIERNVDELASALGWSEWMLSGMAHPIRQTETAIEQTAIAAGLAKPGSRLLVSPSKALETPVLREVPHLPESIDSAGHPIASAGRKIGRGAINSVIDFVNFFQTPEGAALIGTGNLSPMYQKALLRTFAVQMAIESPGQLTDAVEQAKAGNLQQAAQSATTGGGGIVLGRAMASQAASGRGVPVPGRIPDSFMESSERIAGEHLEADIPRREQHAQLAPGSYQVPLKPGETALGERAPLEPTAQPKPGDPLVLPPIQPITQEEQDAAAAVGPATEAAVKETPTQQPKEQNAIQKQSPDEGVLREKRSGVELPQMVTGDKESQVTAGTQTEGKEPAQPGLTREDIGLLMTPTPPGSPEEIGLPSLTDIQVQKALDKWNGLRPDQRAEALERGLLSLEAKMAYTDAQDRANPSAFLKRTMGDYLTKHVELTTRLVDELAQYNPGQALEHLKYALNNYTHALLDAKRVQRANALYIQNNLNLIPFLNADAGAEIVNRIRTADAVADQAEGFRKLLAEQYERLTGGEEAPKVPDIDINPPPPPNIRGMFDRESESQGLGRPSSPPTMGDILAKKLQDRLDRARMVALTNEARYRGVRSLPGIGAYESREETVGSYRVGVVEGGNPEMRMLTMRFAREGSVPKLKTYAPAIRLKDGTIVFMNEVPKKIDPIALKYEPNINYLELLHHLKELGLDMLRNPYSRGWLTPEGQFLASAKQLEFKFPRTPDIKAGDRLMVDPPSTRGMFDKQGEAQGTSVDRGIAASARRSLANRKVLGSEAGMAIVPGGKPGGGPAKFRIELQNNWDGTLGKDQRWRLYRVYDQQGSQVGSFTVTHIEEGKVHVVLSDFETNVIFEGKVGQIFPKGLANAKELTKLIGQRIKADMPEIKVAKLNQLVEPIQLPPGATGWVSQLGPEGGAMVVPPAMRHAANALSKAWEDLRNLARSGFATGGELKAVWKSQENKNIAAGLMDAAENKARIYGRRVQNAIQADVPEIMDRRALTFIMETMKDKGDNPTPTLPGMGGIADKGMLDAELARLPKNHRTQAAIDALNHAKANWDRLLPLAEKIGQRIDEQRAFERDNHVNYDPSQGGYVQHAYDMDAMMGPGRPWIIGSPAGGGGRGGSFKAQELFKTYADAIAKGYYPRTLDAAALTGNRIAIGNRLVNRRVWVEPLRLINDPTDGRPVIDNIDAVDGRGDYKKARILPFLEVNVHPRYHHVIEVLTDRSRVAKSTPGLVALKSEAYIKHSILGFDSFHVGRIVRKMFFLTGKLPVPGIHNLKPFTRILPSFIKGLSVLDMDDATLQKYVDKGEMPQKIIDYARENRPIAENLINQGLNVGRIQEALYADTVRAVPLFGRFNQWTFESLTRSAMMEAGIIEYKRLARSRPELSEEQRARVVARDLNFYFGNIGRQGVFKSQTYRDMLRIPFLAPQWVESMAQTELGALRQWGQFAKGAFKGNLAMGSLGKGVGTGLVAYAAATQLLNLAFRGHLTFDNPEEDHKWDAWLPDITGDHPEGIFQSPLNNQAELSWDFIKGVEDAEDSKVFDPVTKIISNKGSPEMRAIYTILTGNVSGTHEKIDGTWNRIIEAGYNFQPVPMNLQPLLPMLGATHGDYPGRLMKQVMGSTGERVTAARTAEGEVAKLARDFNTKQGVSKSSVITPYQDAPYHVLKMALRTHDEKKIEEALRKITGSGKATLDKVGNEMAAWMGHPFTGSQDREGAFVASLNPEQKQMYQRAMADKMATLREFSRAYAVVAAEQGTK